MTVTVVLMTATIVLMTATIVLMTATIVLMTATIVPMTATIVLMAIAFRFMAHIYLFSSMIGIVYQSQNITLHSPTHVRPQRGRQFPLAKSITSAAGRCLFPPRQIYHICRRQMSIPPSPNLSHLPQADVYSPSPNLSHLPQADVYSPIAKSITSAAGRCLFPPRQIYHICRRQMSIPHRQIYHICRRQMSIPPRYLWRGGGRQAGGEVRELGIEIKGQNPTARPIEMRSSYRSTDRNAIERATAEQFHRVYIDRYRPRNTAVRVHRLSPYDNR